MANVIKIKKGLDINLKGKASDVLLNGGKSDTYAIVPDYYNGIVPKVVAKVGEKVKAGSVLMIDKKPPGDQVCFACQWRSNCRKSRREAQSAQRGRQAGSAGRV